MLVAISRFRSVGGKSCGKQKLRCSLYYRTHVSCRINCRSMCFNYFFIRKKEKIIDKKFKLVLWLSIFALLIQILLGTQVRSEVDIVSKSLHYAGRETWLKNIGTFLQAHELFAWVAALCCIFAAGKSFNYSRLQKRGLLIIVLTIGEVLLGLIMTQLKMPAFSQPFAFIIFFHADSYGIRPMVKGKK